MNNLLNLFWPFWFIFWGDRNSSDLSSHLENVITAFVCAINGHVTSAERVNPRKLTRHNLDVVKI